jgi:hypothetical protein
MQQYGARIVKVLLENQGKSRGAILVTSGGNLPIKGVGDLSGKNSVDLMKKFQEVVSSDPRIDRVVIAARWAAYFDPGSLYRLDGMPLYDMKARGKALQELGSMIRGLVDQGKHVTLVLNIPTGPELDPKNMITRTFTGNYLQEKKVLSKQAFLQTHGEILETIAKTARSNGAEVIDPMDYLCKDGICIAEDENGPIRFDDGHLRPGFVRDHVFYLDRTLAP